MKTEYAKLFDGSAEKHKWKCLVCRERLKTASVTAEDVEIKLDF